MTSLLRLIQVQVVPHPHQAPTHLQVLQVLIHHLIRIPAGKIKLRQINFKRSINMPKINFFSDESRKGRTKKSKNDRRKPDKKSSDKKGRFYFYFFFW